MGQITLSLLGLNAKDVHNAGIGRDKMLRGRVNTENTGLVGCRVQLKKEGLSLERWGPKKRACVRHQANFKAGYP